MKILSDDEKNAHFNHVLSEGFKGLVYGGALSAGIFSFLKFKRPTTFASFSPSIKAAILTMPTIALGAFWADQGSWEFDKMMHQSEYNESEILKKHKEFNQLSTTDKIITKLNEHKYEIIVGIWGASLYGSWVIINRDKYMTTAQKLVQARVVSQFISILLLLATLGLSMRDAEIKKNQPKPIPEWRKVLEEQGKSK
ncbi:RCF2 [Candida pseudojiufengensis]|uniref:RCF2 n=1 Tax=Candida pseudojiufengensis TaxID=497109 RepID=UPI0022242415|nr:RCF2 [Candida pseudojiufengensis]KAI5960160.1 RCF2 [Candida pseudojiufengensis]